MRKTSKRIRKSNQRMYKMRGCSKSRKNRTRTRTNKRTRTRKHHLGGSSNMGADLNLAYPSNNIQTTKSPFLAYTGKGGASYPQYPPSTLPNTGPKFHQSPGSNFINPIKRGGGGVPNGLTGSPWTGSPNNWPGVNNVQGGNNHYELNSYKQDPQTAMLANTGSQPRLYSGGKKGRSKKNGSKKQKGGNISNFLGQDLLNLGRQMQFGVGSAYNSFNGYAQQNNNPLPWKGQLNASNINNIKQY